MEAGAMVRIDSTVTAALMHEPSDRALLQDAVRVMSRLLCKADELSEAAAIRWHDRRRTTSAALQHPSQQRRPALALSQTDRRH
jgi:hypothetical protein